LSALQSTRLPEIQAAQPGRICHEPGGPASLALSGVPFAVPRAQGSVPPPVQSALSALRKSPPGENCQRPGSGRRLATAEEDSGIAGLPLRSLPREVLRHASAGPQRRTRIAIPPGATRSLRSTPLDIPRAGAKNRRRSRSARPRDNRSRRREALLASSHGRLRHQRGSA